jgi:hypothetical protein
MTVCRRDGPQFLFHEFWRVSRRQFFMTPQQAPKTCLASWPQRWLSLAQCALRHREIDGWGRMPIFGQPDWAERHLLHLLTAICLQDPHYQDKTNFET